MLNGSWVNAIVAGDVTFTNMEYDVTTLATKLGERLHTTHYPRFMFSFNYARAYADNIEHYWQMIPTNESVMLGGVGHFQVAFAREYLNNGRAFIGIMPQLKYNTYLDNYFGFQGDETNVGLYIYGTFSSIYSAYTADKQEFSFLKLVKGDRLGVFIDLRDPEDGRAFITHNGVMIAQLCKGVKESLLGGVCLRETNRKKARKVATIVYGGPLPIGWDDPKFRDDNYLASLKHK
jgi:hypothetical protein